MGALAGEWKDGRIQPETQLDAPQAPQPSPGPRPTILDFLRQVVEQKCSDLHIKAGSPPSVRLSGRLVKTQFPPMTAPECREAAEALMDDEQLAHLKRVGEVDFAYSERGVGRFRVNVHHQRGSVAMAARLVLPGAPDFKSLGLPPRSKRLANEHRGSAARDRADLVGQDHDHRGDHQPHQRHPPVPHPHDRGPHRDPCISDLMAIVTQREIGRTPGLRDRAAGRHASGPRRHLRGRDPRHRNRRAALQAAETGHFVIATLHTTDVAETVNRVIDFFPPHQQKQARVAWRAHSWA